MLSISILGAVRLVLCSFNLGAICYVQAVHYPLFRNVGENQFQKYHQLHVKRTSLLLGVTLSVEMLLTLVATLQDTFSWIHNIPLAFLSLGWLVTFLVSVPQHRRLERGFSEKAHQTLLLSNRIRVICWGGALLGILNTLWPYP